MRGHREIEIFWQVRYRYEKGKLLTIDAQGEVESVVKVASVRYGDPWRLAGTIALDDSLIEFCGVSHFDFFAYSLMRHSTNLIAGGWGDTPEEVLNWFDNLTDLDFLLDTVYKISAPTMEPFKSLVGQRVEVSTSEDGGRIGYVLVKEDKFLFDLEDEDVLIPFLISSVPERGDH